MIIDYYRNTIENADKCLFYPETKDKDRLLKGLKFSVLNNKSFDLAQLEIFFASILLEVDYSVVYLASLVSGKGLSAYTGIAIVIYNHELEKPKKTIPFYLSLYEYHRCGGIPFSGSSNLLYALVTSLDELNLEERLQKIKIAYQKIIETIASSPFQLFKVKDGAVMITFSIPKTLSSMIFGGTMEHKGFLLHYRSKYLQEKNLLQIALMSQESVTSYPKMLEVLLETYTALTENQTKKKLAH